MIAFMFPLYTMLTAVEVRNPDFMDAEAVLIEPKYSTMMNGDIRSRRATPVPTRLTLKFTSISRRKALELQAFVELSAGDWVRYIDQNLVSWKGKIVAEPFDIATVSRGLGSEPRKEFCDIDLVFEGVRL